LRIEAPPDIEDTDKFNNWMFTFWKKLIAEDIYASDTWDAASIADGDEEAKDVTVTGAAIGDYAVASLSIDIADLMLDAQVTAANTVTCVLSNNTGGAVDLASATVYVRVFRRAT
jgi:hypothetical protein